MNEHQKIPLNSETQKHKRVIDKYPLNTIYPEPMEDDLYHNRELVKPNKVLDKTTHENSENSN